MDRHVPFYAVPVKNQQVAAPEPKAVLNGGFQTGGF